MDFFQTADTPVQVVGIVNAHPLFAEVATFRGEPDDRVRLVVALQHRDGRKFQAELLVNVEFVRMLSKYGEDFHKLMEA